MASGLQCPGCGHVHPSGLPEIARGDSTFRCYGCYRTLSIPDGWTGRATSRPAPPSAPPADVPPGAAGTRDARSARLAGRRGFWPSAGAAAPTGSPAGDPGPITELVPVTSRGSAPAPGSDPASSRVPGSTVEPGGPDTRAGGWRAGGADSGAVAGRAGTGAGSKVGRPHGWVAPRRSVKPVPAALRALIWVFAFSVAFAVTTVVLKEIGLLGVNNVIDLYAGSGLHRFGILLAMLPIWALLSATLAHFALEALAARRRRSARSSPATGPSAPA